MTSARLVYVLSPAKTLNFTTSSISQCTQPRQLSHTHELVEQLRTLSHTKIKSLFGVSDALAKLNVDRYQVFNTSKSATEASNPSKTLKQAVLAFSGPAYQGLGAYNLSKLDVEYAQTHLRILCGLYGILRPLDLIQPYRLEMGQKLANSRGKDLYEFWGDTIVYELDALFSEEEAKENVKQQRVVVNVASQEYFKSLPQSALKAAGIMVVTCVFKDDGKIKSVYAKRARGLMCRYLIQKRVDSLKGITGFDLEGYKYASTASSDDTYVFTRTGAEQKLGLQQTNNVNAMSSVKAKRRVKNSARSQSVVEVKIENDQDRSQLRRSTRKKRKTK
ncbi:unnamed protein product [Peronospora effusa]|uniref:Uncharacterized protein n=1 Tax=Peronospora effusa TaxID=542832 RepID=A0A3M6V9M2_9STRA|nr:hypothetical protein DD238_006877 [Peronospora effusa]CAI5721286.1 unnamed protein product [Peronospora effusa]